MEIKTIRVMASLSRNYQKTEFEIDVEPSEGEAPTDCATEAEKYCLTEAHRMLEAAEKLTEKKQQEPAPAPVKTFAPTPAPLPTYSAPGSRPISDKQIALLKKLGYQGDVSGWSAKQASATIDQYMSAHGRH